jgi:hypothetical protein
MYIRICIRTGSQWNYCVQVLATALKTGVHKIEIFVTPLGLTFRIDSRKTECLLNNK